MTARTDLTDGDKLILWVNGPHRSKTDIYRYEVATMGKRGFVPATDSKAELSFFLTLYGYEIDYKTLKIQNNPGMYRSFQRMAYLELRKI